MLGNHETMIFTEDICYVTTKEQFIARFHGTSYTCLFDIRHSLLGAGSSAGSHESKRGAARPWRCGSGVESPFRRDGERFDTDLHVGGHFLPVGRHDHGSDHRR